MTCGTCRPRGSSCGCVHRWAYRCAPSYDLRGERLCVDAVQRDPLALEHARGAALVYACRPHGCSCGGAQRWARRCVYASNDLHADPVVVLDAVQQYPLALKYAWYVWTARGGGAQRWACVMHRMICALTRCAVCGASSIRCGTGARAHGTIVPYCTVVLAAVRKDGHRCVTSRMICALTLRRVLDACAAGSVGTGVRTWCLGALIARLFLRRCAKMGRACVMHRMIYALTLRLC